MGNFGKFGLSPVQSENGMAATSHHLATETAIEILKAGGNALDAAVGACAVQCVVEPQSTGIGGDCFCMYAPSGSDQYVAYNGSGRAPTAANLQWYLDQGCDEILPTSPHAVTIPGAVDAWDRLVRDHGSLPLSEILKPAINHARSGHPVTERVGYDFANSGDKLKDCENASAVFRPGGSILKVGETILQPKLADTLEIIGEHGRAGFYQGDVAEDIVSYLNSRGGLHTLDDFKNARGNYVTPISANYKGYDVYQCPPNGQGIIALMLLKLIERFERVGESPLNLTRMHQEIEACRLTYHQRDAYVADPDQVYVPAREMLSDKNIDQMFEKITESKIDPIPDFQMPEHKDTVYITVVDKDRNCCSFINTLFHNFGCGLMAPKSGVMLQCRGAGFSLESGHPNVIAGAKRPLHTIIPAMVAKGGRTVMSFGVMGGAYQAFGQMQFLSRYLDYGYDIQAAMDMPRVFANPVTGEVEFEAGIDEKIIEGLKEKGHIFEQDTSFVGGSQAIWIDWENNMLTGGSDPRKDGCAIGY